MDKKAYQKQWRIDNKERIREYDKGRDKEKMKLGINKKLQKIRTVRYNSTVKGIVVRRKCSKTWKRKNPKKAKQVLRNFEIKNPENHRVRKVMSGEGSKTKFAIKKDIIAMQIYITKLEKSI